MDWIKLVSDIEASGLTQKEIGDKIGCSQAHVSDIRRGEKRPGFAVGMAILEQHAALKKLKKQVTA